MPVRATFLPPFLLCLLFLASCRPADEAAQAKRHVTQSGIPLPPELIEAAGVAAKDERAEIILLLPDTRLAMQALQRDGLAMLIGRQPGYKLTTHDATGSAALQAKQLRQAIAAKPAAILLNPLDPPALAALIIEAQSTGIHVIGLDKRLLKDGCTSVAYCDQREIGRSAAQTVLAALKRKAAEENRAEVTGRVVQLRGEEHSFATDEIAAGFQEGLQAAPGVILVHDAAADWSADAAFHRLNEAFRLQKNFDVIYAHSDVIALGAVKAAEGAGQRDNLFIIGTEGISDQRKGLQLVRRGEIDATIVQPALVDLALQIIVKLRSDKKFKPRPVYEIQPVAVTSRTVDQALNQGTYALPGL